MSVEDDLKRIDEKQKAALLQVEKRLVNLESGLSELQSRITAGVLTPQQEQRVTAVEERLENTEDLEMLNRMDIIKIKENIGAGTGAPVADAMTHKRLDDLESALRSLNEKFSAFDTSKIREVEKIMEKAERINAVKISNDIDSLKEEFSSFRKETEDSMEKIVSSIRKIAERI